jgi:hypothetical protein
MGLALLFFGFGETISIILPSPAPLERGNYAREKIREAPDLAKPISLSSPESSLIIVLTSVELS